MILRQLCDTSFLCYSFYMREIVQKENPILREVAKPVPVSEIASDKIQRILSDMKEAMASQKDGIAIAAPQIGENMRIFVVSGILLKKADRLFKGNDSDMVFINPELIKSSKEKKEAEEGCLSIRWFYGKVNRRARVTIRAFNEKGEAIERGASGVLAQIFQHEIDHLNGILFTDKTDEVWEMTEDEIKELQTSD